MERFVVLSESVVDSLTCGEFLGLMPISGAHNETRKLFFWFFPSKDMKHTDDLVCVALAPLPAASFMH